jgi:uncharacterized membrane protein YciS (DUF1049 family)
MALIPIIGLVIAFVVFGLMYRLREEDVEQMIKEMKKEDDLEIKKV